MILSLILSTSSDLFNRSKPIVTLERTLDEAAPSRHLIELVSTAAIAAGLTAPGPDPSDPDTCEEGERTTLLRRIREQALTILDLRAAVTRLELEEQVIRERVLPAGMTADAVICHTRNLDAVIAKLSTELDKVAGETEARVREELERPEYTTRGHDVLASQYPIGTVLNDELGDYRTWCVAIGREGVKVFRYVGDPTDGGQRPTAAGSTDDTDHLNSYTVWKLRRP